MTPTRAWVFPKSGRQINLLDPKPDSWDDSDLAIGLSRTYRWGGHSQWELPISVAQRSLLELALRRQMQASGSGRPKCRSRKDYAAATKFVLHVWKSDIILSSGPRKTQHGCRCHLPAFFRDRAVSLGSGRGQVA